jgi:NitT/TauT family transport system permease protein
MIWVLVLTCWEGAYRIIQWEPYKFPAPSHVLDRALSLLNIHTAFSSPLHPGWPRPQVERTRPHAPPPVWDSPLLIANVVSLTRLAVGFAVSILLGGALGLAMWRWTEFDAFIGPVLLGLQTLPSVCWVPLAVLLLGLNETGILFVLVMGSFSAVSIAMRDGLRLIPPLFPRAGMMLGAKGWKLYRYVLLPASMPAISASLRQGFAFAWRSLMGAEVNLFTDRHGLGFLLESGRDLSDISQVVAVMIVMVLIGMLADRWIFARIQARVQARFGLG